MSGRIRLMTSQHLAATVAQRWRDQYRDRHGTSRLGVIAQRLDDLPPDTPFETVEEIIGNTSWTRNWCGVCEQPVTAWLHLGDEPDYDSNTFYICLSCFDTAGDAVQASEATPNPVRGRLPKEKQ